MAGLIGDFAVGLSLHLRGELRPDHLESLTEEERSVASLREHRLSYVAHLIWKEVERHRRVGALETGQIILVEPHARAFLDILGACERIRSTPIPFALTAAIRLFLFVFAIFLPIGLHGDFGWIAVPVSMFAFFVLAAMDTLSAELENPFGHDCNDLATRSIGEMIRRQVHEAVESTRVGMEDEQPRKPVPYTKIH